MTRDNIIRMAREAGIEVHERKQEVRLGLDVLIGSSSTGRLKAFADLVAAAEREACAQVAKSISDKYAFGYYGNEVDTADEIEAAIRARGEKGRAA